MAADGGRSIAQSSLASQVCAHCKTRKKKCDKALPRCGYCVRKELSCLYGQEQEPPPPPSPPSTGNRAVTAPPISFQAVSLTIPAEPTASSEAKLYLQVLGLIRETGQFVDDVSARYFHGVHRYLPIISRTRFHNNLITLGATSSAGFSVLLVAICLASSSPELGRRTGYVSGEIRQVTRRSLYLAARSLFAQVQACFRPSVHLIQAGLLLAVYEYVNGRPDEAFASIAGCARMAYAARIHLCNHSGPQTPSFPEASADKDAYLQLQSQEAANTWWGIVIYERTFFCDVAVTEQPLITLIPGEYARLPTEPVILEESDHRHSESIIHLSVSCLSSTNVGASWLLDQVLKGFEVSSIDSRLFQLQSLDNTLQTFLGVLMQQSNEKGSVFCEAIAIVISGMSHSPKELHEYSKAALDTAMKMVLDIVEAHENSDPYLLTCVTPSYPYLVRAALKHIYGRSEWKDDDSLKNAEKRLRTALDQFSHSWNATDS
ncbi:hypothetical protein EV356DRAFT_455759 [Viridothelium virens]|uniref:Zn(2)-C6 fungal-type domain-containing protein n=1 Tax=Viridothelium virens TaxID=1048519 RepID=A0A6A6GV19_VIRVR|nr:hypothetical protein EV356DRAFT_455759 [Viridothelium virens]